jgi:hypothetical protein
VRQHLSHVLIVVDQEHAGTASIRHSRWNSRGSLSRALQPYRAGSSPVSGEIPHSCGRIITAAAYAVYRSKWFGLRRPVWRAPCFDSWLCEPRRRALALEIELITASGQSSAEDVAMAQDRERLSALFVNDADLREPTRRLTGTFAGARLRARVDADPASGQNDGREALAQPGRAPAF